MNRLGVGTVLKSVTIVVIASFAAFLHMSPVHAVSSDSRMFISGDNTFYAYAKGGEAISVLFTRSGLNDEGGLAPADITTSIEGPGLSKQECTLAKNISPGQGCSFKNITAPQSGIYKISFSLPSSASTFDQVSPNVKWNGNLFSWNITVTDGKTEKPGRVWSELYAIRQPVAASYLADLSYYYVSESGYIYRGLYKGYNGQISTLSADAVGIRKANTCESAYQSVDVGNANMSPSFGSCGGSYKIFFEQPAGDLPQKATRADDSSDWVSPSIARPTFSDVTFTSDKNPNQQSGTVSFKLSNFVGQYTVRIDTTGDGSYDSKADVKFVRTLKKQTDAVQKIQFNGIDGMSQPISPTQKIGIKIEIQKVAEIHLVSSDVEGRVGGLELTRLNGDNAPTTRMCWDDTNLTTLSDESLQTKDPDGRNCPDSTGGVHGWPYATGSWGDVRYIDDWAYAKANIVGQNEIQYPSDTEVAAITKRSINPVITAAVGALLIAVVIGFIATILIRRARHKKRLQQATEHHDAFTPPSRNM